ncbi:MAG: class I SAM-dependent methyltransferase [Chloroflexi bacterium]|nr:class I SAM-dependent methyltransferase [Chloroflexota bacterium]
MEPEQYDVMFRREDRHWWYTGMRHAALALLRQALAGRTGLRILDAGCGTGGTTIRLREFGDVYGSDLHQEALGPAASRGLDARLAQASVERLPFASGSFDLVTSFEVLYHLGVGSDAAALAEFRRVLRPCGLLLLRLPGHDWLRGQHDRLVHTKRRYTVAEVRAKLIRAGFRVEYATWANSALFLPAAAKRLLDGVRPAHSEEPDLWMPPAIVNSLLTQVVAFEGLAFSRRIPLPMGLSALVLARAP